MTDKRRIGENIGCQNDPIVFGIGVESTLGAFQSQIARDGLLQFLNRDVATPGPAMSQQRSGVGQRIVDKTVCLKTFQRQGFASQRKDDKAKNISRQRPDDGMREGR